jgi:hypothetical protein
MALTTGIRRGSAPEERSSLMTAPRPTMLLRGLGSRAPLGAAAGGRRALEETAIRRGCRPRRPSARGAPAMRGRPKTSRSLLTAAVSSPCDIWCRRDSATVLKEEGSRRSSEAGSSPNRAIVRSPRRCFFDSASPRAADSGSPRSTSTDATVFGPGQRAEFGCGCPPPDATT